MHAAAAKYRSAIAQDPTDPAPLRTLSSAQFEQGDYSACLKSIQSALALEKDESKLPALRLRKAKCHFYLRQFEAAKDALDVANSKDADAANMLAAIEAYSQSTFPATDEEMKKVWEDILRLPRFRSSLHPSSMEYFPRGHDDPQAAYTDKDLDNMADKGDIDVSILYGGVGDGRHLFQQLSHINGFFIDRIDKHRETQKKVNAKRAAKGLPEERKEPYGEMDIYLAAQDAKSHVIARILIMLKLMDDIGICLVPDAEPDVEKRVALATLPYIYLADIMPSYCRERLDKAMKDLLDDADKPNFGIRFVQTDEETKKEICKVLEWWISNCKGMPVPGGEPTVEQARALPLQGFGGQEDPETGYLPGISEENEQFKETRMAFPFSSLMHDKEPELESLLKRTEGKKKERIRVNTFELAKIDQMALTR